MLINPAGRTEQRETVTPPVLSHYITGWQTYLKRLVIIWISKERHARWKYLIWNKHYSVLCWVRFCTFWWNYNQCCSYFCFMLILLLQYSRTRGKVFSLPLSHTTKAAASEQDLSSLKSRYDWLPQSASLLWFMMFKQSARTRPTPPSAFWKEESRSTCRHVHQTPTVHKTKLRETIW